MSSFGPDSDSQPASPLVLLDVDGVLAPIVARPELSSVPEATLELLRGLLDRYRLVACVSGRTLAEVRRRGWAHSVAERETGVASVSAPVRGRDGRVLAAVSVSGPLERLTRSPGRLHAEAVCAAAADLARS